MSALADLLNGVSVCVLGASAFWFGKALGIVNRRAARHDAEMTQLWDAFARLGGEVAQLAETLAGEADPAVSAGLDRLQHGMDQMLADLQAMDAQVSEWEDAAGGSRGVHDINDPEGADPS